MKVTFFSEPWQKLVDKLKKNKLLIILILAGLVLLIIPWGSLKSGDAENKTSDVGEPDFSLEQEQKRIEAALSKIDGAGEVTVLLSLKSGVSREVASDEESESRNQDNDSSSSASKSTVKIQTGSGSQNALTLRYIYPVYQGALVITESANSSVKLAITEAVSALTGLSTDKITVVKGR